MLLMIKLKSIPQWRDYASPLKGTSWKEILYSEVSIYICFVMLLLRIVIRFKLVLNLFGNLLQHYCKHELSNIGGAIPFENKSPMFMDLLSAPDVVAGSIEHYFSRAHVQDEELKIKEEADHVLGWLSGLGFALKKHTMIIRSQS